MSKFLHISAAYLPYIFAFTGIWIFAMFFIATARHEPRAERSIIPATYFDRRFMTHPTKRGWYRVHFISHGEHYLIDFPGWGYESCLTKCMQLERDRVIEMDDVKWVESKILCELIPRLESANESPRTSVR